MFSASIWVKLTLLSSILCIFTFKLVNLLLIQLKIFSTFSQQHFPEYSPWAQRSRSKWNQIVGWAWARQASCLTCSASDTHHPHTNAIPNRNPSAEVGLELRSQAHFALTFFSLAVARKLAQYNASLPSHSQSSVASLLPPSSARVATQGNHQSPSYLGHASLAASCYRSAKNNHPPTTIA